MTTSQSLADALLRFTDDVYTGTEDVDVEELELKLLDVDFEGVLLGAPSSVSVDTAQGLRLALGMRLDGTRDWDIRPIRNTFLVGCDLETGRVVVEPALLTEKDMQARNQAPAKVEPRPDDEDLEGEAAFIDWVETRKRMGLPWKAGQWSFTAVYHDWISNRQEVRFFGEAPDGEPATFEATPAGPAARFIGAEAPAAPADGAAFEIGIEGQGPTSALRVKGSFAVGARSFTAPATETFTEAGEAHPLRATVPVTLLVCGVRRRYPLRADWAVPVIGSPDATGLLSASFDVVAMPTGATVELGSGTVHAYLVVAGALHGPVALEMP